MLEPWQAYSLAILAVGATLGLRLIVHAQLNGQPTLVVFTIPIIVAAYLGGWRGGLLATGASLIAAKFFLLPAADGIVVPWQLSFLGLAGVTLSVVTEALHRARRRIDRAVAQHRAAETALQQSEARYRAVVDWSPEPVVIHRDGALLFVNPAAVTMFGAAHAADLVGKPITTLIHPDSRETAFHRMKMVSNQNESAPMMELKALKLDGTTFDVEVQGRQIDFDGQPALMASLRDISGRKTHEIELGRTNRLYAALSAVNQAIVRLPARDALFHNVCRVLVELGGFGMARIRWQGTDPNVLESVASWGDEEGSAGSQPIYFDDRPQAHAPPSVAFREGRPSVINDLRRDPGMQGWADEVARRGYGSAAGFPIRVAGVVRGTLSVTANEAEYFQDKEIVLLAEVADDVSFALDNIARDDDAREAALAVTHERDRFRSLFESAPLGMVIADTAGTYLDANPAASQMLGYTRAELIGLNAAAIVAANEFEKLEPAMRRITKTSGTGGEWHLRRKDGSILTAETMSTQMPDGNLMAMIRDVSERNEAVEALRTAEERMRFALQNANVGIWDMNYTTGVLQWSEKLEAHYGVAPGAFGGTFDAFIERVHPDDRESLLETLEKAVKSGEDFTLVNRALWPDGSIRYLSGAGRVILGANGEPARGIGISLDITEQRALEQQYLQSQKMEAVGRLAGGVAHDFNNLLTAILGYCELLAADLDPLDPRLADVEEIRKAGVRAAGLTRQLLAFSRRQIIEPKLLDLNAVVTDTRAMLGRLIGEDVAIVLRLELGLRTVKADRGQVEQVIMNLALNSRDAMPKGGTLTIETANVELDADYTDGRFGVEPGSYVMLGVRDTGTGMTAEVQTRLFEPFFTTKDVGKGTGLGLATVHGIVARAGGTVDVHSDIGIGTIFRVYFPVAKLKAAPAEPAEPAELPRAGAHAVLVVDDEERLGELTRRVLERQGYTVFVATSADQALRLFEANPSIDVLLTDVVMPGTSGPELSKKLVDRRPALNVIYMSGYTDDEIVHHGVLDDGVALLSKPFTSDALGRKLREVLAR